MQGQLANGRRYSKVEVDVKAIATLKAEAVLYATPGAQALRVGRAPDPGVHG